MASKNLQNLYDYKYQEEEDEVIVLRPDAWTTTRYDDTARLLQGQSQGGSLLEIGCGQGSFLLALEQQFAKLVGLDLSEVRIKKAQRRLENHPELAEKIRFIAGDVDKGLPFDTATFDCVIMCAVLEHVVDVFGVMDEIARVCKIGGCVVIAVPNVCYVRHLISLLMGKVPRTGTPNRDIEYWRKNGWDGAHLHYFSKSILDKLLRNTGFIPEKWTGGGRLGKLRRWYINFSGGLVVRARRV